MNRQRLLGSVLARSLKTLFIGIGGALSSFLLAYVIAHLICWGSADRSALDTQAKAFAYDLTARALKSWDWGVLAEHWHVTASADKPNPWMEAYKKDFGVVDVLGLPKGKLRFDIDLKHLKPRWYQEIKLAFTASRKKGEAKITVELFGSEWKVTDFCIGWVL